MNNLCGASWVQQLYRNEVWGYCERWFSRPWAKKNAHHPNSISTGGKQWICGWNDWFGHLVTIYCEDFCLAIWMRRCLKTYITLYCDVEEIPPYSLNSNERTTRWHSALSGFKLRNPTIFLTTFHSIFVLSLETLHHNLICTKNLLLKDRKLHRKKINKQKNNSLDPNDQFSHKIDSTIAQRVAPIEFSRFYLTEIDWVAAFRWFTCEPYLLTWLPVDQHWLWCECGSSSGGGIKEKVNARDELTKHTRIITNKSSEFCGLARFFSSS